MVRPVRSKTGSVTPAASGMRFKICVLANKSPRSKSAKGLPVSGIQMAFDLKMPPIPRRMPVGLTLCPMKNAPCSPYSATTIVI